MSKENQLPQKVDPFRMADNAAHFHGVIPLKAMSRLAESLHNNEGEVVADFAFRINEQKIKLVNCSFKTQLPLRCQRCMQPFLYTIQGSLEAALVHNHEEAERLPKEYDPIVVNDGTIAPQDIVEDELIICLPIVPMHTAADCTVKLPQKLDSADSAESEKDNPFKVIELLRSKKHDSS